MVIANSGAATNLTLGGILQANAINGFNMSSLNSATTIKIINDLETNGISTSSNFTNAVVEHASTAGGSRVAFASDNGLTTYELINNGTSVTLGNQSTTNYWYGSAAFGTDNWSSGLSWSSAVPSMNNLIADFDASQSVSSLWTSADYTATLDANETVRGLQFNSNGSYTQGFTIAQGGSNTLTLDGSTNTATSVGGNTITAGTATVYDIQGNQTVAVPVSLTTTVANVVADSASTLKYSANITGSGGFRVFGPGAVSLTGTNSYTGATTVNTGILYTNYNNGGTFTSAITVANGATFSPGNYALASGTGTFNTSAGVTLSSGSILDIVLNSNTGASDLIKTSGLLSLTNVTLNTKDIGSNLSSSNLFYLAETTGGSGLFANNSSSAFSATSYSIDGNTYNLGYGQISGNTYGYWLSEQLAVVPEAQPWQAILIVCAMLAFLHRKKEALVLNSVDALT